MPDCWSTFSIRSFISRTFDRVLHDPTIINFFYKTNNRKHVTEITPKNIDDNFRHPFLLNLKTEVLSIPRNNTNKKTEDA